jgi:hypothetical protein
LGKVFIGVQAGDDAWCISCAEEQFGDMLVEVLAKTGKEGTFFTAIYVGSPEHDSRPCAGCATPMNEA